MRFLVTAGNTQAPIDRVRCLTNVFSGKTGASIALEAQARGHEVRLLTSHPEVVKELQAPGADLSKRWVVLSYRTFDELADLMAKQFASEPPGVVIHSAAVSDYLVTGVFSPSEATRFESDGRWVSEVGPPRLRDRMSGKVKSNEPELWLRLTRAPKLVDRIRSDWKFTGILVKFKLEVGVDDERLREVAEKSRRQSGADFMVANTLEGASAYAYLGPVNGEYQRVVRNELASRLIEAIEQASRETVRG